MNLLLKALAIRVKNLPKDNKARILTSEAIYDDMPLLLKDEYTNRFMKKKFNEGKDVVDFYFIKLSQMNKFFKGDKDGSGISFNNFSKEYRPKTKEEPEYKPQQMQNSMKIGDIIKNKNGLDKS